MILARASVQCFGYHSRVGHVNISGCNAIALVAFTMSIDTYEVHTSVMSTKTYELLSHKSHESVMAGYRSRRLRKPRAWGDPKLGVINENIAKYRV